ncbi:MAG: recombinase family protein [Lachnospiraceae bacterium]|nr:recombinase family protein [Lachnospiraceae bacterium]
MEKKKLKCYIYMRVSTAMQVEGYSLDAQRERVTRYAEFQGIEIIREYCDAGKSGKSITGRPEFTQMLQDIADGRDNVDYVLVFKLSRFGRNAADVLNSLQYIQDFGVNLICVEDGIDSAKDSGKLTITVLSAVAEIERENILVQTMEGRKQKAREGKWNGGQAPYGYRINSKTSELVVEPNEAEIVKIIYDKFANENMGFEAVANYLNQHGYTKDKYRDSELDYFTRGLIKNILDNPVYIGKITYGKNVMEKVKGTRDQYRRVKADDYMVVDGKHDAIIDDELWFKVREKRKSTGVAWTKTYSLDHEHLLSGILKCPICGVGMAGTVTRKHKKKTGETVDTFFYRCKHRKKIDDDHFCNFKYSLNEDEINLAVENVILDMVNHEGFRNFVTEKMGEKVDVSSMEEEREQYRRQLAQVSGAKNKLMQQLDALDVKDKHYNRKYQDMQDRLDNLYDKINDLESEIDDINGKIAAVNAEHITSQEVFLILSHFDKMYYKMTDAEKKEFLQNFIERIELYPEKQENGNILKEIYFKFPVYYGGDDDNSPDGNDNGPGGGGSNDGGSNGGNNVGNGGIQVMEIGCPNEIPSKLYAYCPNFIQSII